MPITKKLRSITKHRTKQTRRKQMGIRRTRKILVGGSAKKPGFKARVTKFFSRFEQQKPVSPVIQSFGEGKVSVGNMRKEFVKYHTSKAAILKRYFRSKNLQKTLSNRFSNEYNAASVLGLKQEKQAKNIASRVNLEVAKAQNASAQLVTSATANAIAAAAAAAKAAPAAATEPTYAAVRRSGSTTAPPLPPRLPVSSAQTVQEPPKTTRPETITSAIAALRKTGLNPKQNIGPQRIAAPTVTNSPYRTTIQSLKSAKNRVLKPPPATTVSELEKKFQAMRNKRNASTSSASTNAAAALALVKGNSTTSGTANA